MGGAGPLIGNVMQSIHHGTMAVLRRPRDDPVDDAGAHALLRASRILRLLV
jgi:hypothetical protein